MSKPKSKRDIEKAIKLHTEDGLSAYKISKILGWSPNTVISYLRKHNVFDKRRNTGYRNSPTLEEKILPVLGKIHQRYLDGELVDDLATEFEISRNRLFELLRKHYYTLPERSLDNLKPYETFDWEGLADHAELIRRRYDETKK